MPRPGRRTTSARIHRFADGRLRSERDVLSVEEPLEIRVALPTPDGRRGLVKSIAVTMRTPGHDFELAAGFLLTEGVLSDRGQIQEITYCRSGEAAQEYNVLEVRLRTADVDLERLSRNVFTSSSCGICGKASIEAVEVQGCAPVAEAPFAPLPPDRVLAFPRLLRSAQDVFERTGGLHAAGIFRAEGDEGLVREDVGRHNAVDKVLGEAFLTGDFPLPDRILAVSGRLSFELVQKAVVARIPMMVAVGAPSSLAVDLAERFGVTLAGFTRGDGFVVYCGAHRVAEPPA